MSDGRSARAAGRAPSCRAGSATGCARDHAPAAARRSSGLTLHHHLLDLGDRACRVQVLGTRVGAVHDGVTAVQAEGILQLIEALPLGVIAAVDDPAVSRQQRGGPEEALAVPPVARAGGRAAGAQDAGRRAVDPLLLLLALQALAIRGRRSAA